MDTLANLLITIKNSELVGAEEVVARPTSKLSTGVLKMMQEHGYIGEFETISDGRGGVYKIKLLHRLNNCGVIKPRFPVKKQEIERWEHRYLPAQGFGMMIISSSKGLLTHAQAKENGAGGKLIAFVY